MPRSACAPLGLADARSLPRAGGPGRPWRPGSAAAAFALTDARSIARAGGRDALGVWFGGRSAGDADFDLGVGHARLVGDLGDAGGAVHDGAVVEPEDALVPRARHRAGIVVDLAALERAAGVGADAP